MSFTFPAVEVLENIIRDYRKNILDVCIPITNTCLSNIENLLMDLLDEILKTQETVRFPNLIEIIKKNVQDKLISGYSVTVKEKVKELIEMEKNYIWTDDEEFLSKLETISGQKQFEVEIMRNTIVNYINTIKKNINHQIPKIIMYFLVSKLENNLHTTLVSILNSSCKLENWLNEDDDIFKKRKQLQERLLILDKANNVFNDNSS